MRNIYWVLLIVLFISCKRNYPANVYDALEKAGKNKEELDKVLQHYKGSADTLKLKAAYFLISNMDGHHSFKGELVTSYDKLFQYANVKLNSKDTYLDWDSLENVFIKPSSKDLKASPDLQNITSAYLIENIDQAFIERRKPIAKSLTFDEFCEFLLPYRTTDGPLDNWRKFATSKYGKIARSAQLKTQQDSACDMINDALKNIYIIGMGSPVHCPYTPALKDQMMLQSGTCDDAGNMTAKIMRAVGIPVGIDFTPHWANASQGHSWNVFLYHHKTIPFMGTESNPGLTKLGYLRKNTIFRKMPKVYRRTFANQPVRVKFLANNQTDVPDFFFNTRIIDVTPEYMPVTDIHMRLKNVRTAEKAAYLCVFDNKNWQAVQYSEIVNQSVTFTGMGRGVLYMPMYYTAGNHTSAGNPLILNYDGTVNLLTADTAKRTVVKLFRKYPEDASNLVEIGDSYELFYWDNSWRSLGRQSADVNYLIYRNVPSNALLLLRDLTKGKQERIFTYQNNQQIWW